MTKFSGKLPEGHGLANLNQQVCADRTKKYMVVGVVEAHAITTDTDTMLSEATVRLRRIELVEGEDMTTVDRLTAAPPNAAAARRSCHST